MYSKLVIKCVGIISLFFLSPHATQAVNLLNNPGFEDGIKNWEVSPSTATASASEEKKHTGNYGVILTKKSSSSWAYINQRVSIETDKYYLLSGWGFLNDEFITNLKLRFYWLDVAGTKISQDPVEQELVSRTSDFQLIQTESKLSPSGAQFADIQAYVFLKTANPSAPAVFDDLVFEQLAPTPTNTPTPQPSDTPTSTATPVPASTATIVPTVLPSKTPTVRPPTNTPMATTQVDNELSSGTAVLGLGSPEEASSISLTNKGIPTKNLIIALLLVGLGLAILAGVLVWQKRLSQHSSPIETNN